MLRNCVFAYLCIYLLFDTQNPEISGFSTAHAYKYKNKRQAKLKQKQQKNDIFVYQSPGYPCTRKVEVCAQTLNVVVLLRRQHQCKNYSCRFKSEECMLVLSFTFFFKNLKINWCGVFILFQKMSKKIDLLMTLNTMHTLLNATLIIIKMKIIPYRFILMYILAPSTTRSKR